MHLCLLKQVRKKKKKNRKIAYYQYNIITD